MEKIIHFTVPEKMTPLHAQTIECARALHPTWKIKVWQDPVQPDGYLLEKYWPKVNSGAQLSDLLRIDILYRWGGVYVDSDLKLLKPLDGLVERFDCFVASETGTTLEGALIGARKEHPAIKSLIDTLLLNEPDWTLPPNKTTGPDFFASILRWNKSVTVLPRETFYCYPPEARSRKTHRHSYGEHLWVYSWKHVNPWIETPRWKLAAKGAMRSAFTIGFRLWHRIKSAYIRALGQPQFYAACDEIVVKTKHGFNIIVDGKDTSVTPELVFGGFYETREEHFCKQILHGGDWTIDIGSKLGFFCMLAAQSVGSFGRVFTYEPNPEILKFLSKSVVMNWMHDRVVLRDAAAGEIVGNATLEFIPGRLGDAQIRSDETINSIIRETSKMIGVDDSTKNNVPCITLDEEFPIDLPIKLLKIDAEGQEVAILKGAQRLIERQCIDFILIRMFREMARAEWRSIVARSRWGELLVQLNQLTEFNYVPCMLAKDGSLVELQSVTAALDKLEGRNLVLMARNQYSNSAAGLQNV